jgi:hypothetical protein
MDAILSLMPLLTRVSSFSPELALQVLERFSQENDRTRYGLMNAVTSVARDSREPVRRWELEELGGQMAVVQIPEPVLDDGAEEAVPRDDERLVVAR